MEKVRNVQKNGPLLILLSSNVIVDETVPVIAEPILEEGSQGVVVTIVLIAP